VIQLIEPMHDGLAVTMIQYNVWCKRHDNALRLVERELFSGLDGAAPTSVPLRIGRNNADV
jgi:hypothetical protein